MATSLEQTYRQSIEAPEKFWGQLAQELCWDKEVS